MSTMTTEAQAFDQRKAEKNLQAAKQRPRWLRVEARDLRVGDKMPTEDRSRRYDTITELTEGDTMIWVSWDDHTTSAYSKDRKMTVLRAG